MKQRPARIAAAALLLAALTACGSDTERGSLADPDLSVTGEQKTDPATGTRYTGEVSDRVVRYGNGYGNTNADRSLHTPTALPGGSADVAGTARDAAENAAKGAESATDTALPRTAERTNYQRMLDNARVHDTDGFLLDGENAAHRTLP